MHPHEYEKMKLSSGVPARKGRRRSRDEGNGPFLKPETPLSSTAPPIEPLLVRPRVAVRLLGCGFDKLWSLINSGELESFLDGTARRISYASIKAYVAHQLSAPPATRRRVRRADNTSPKGAHD
jgi:hypothetical protein